MDEFKGVFVGLPLLDIGFFWSPGRVRPERVTPVKPDQSEKIHPPAKKEKIHPPENDPKKQKEKTDIHER